MKKLFLLVLLGISTMVLLNAQVEEKAAADAAVATTVKAAEIDSAKNWKFTGGLECSTNSPLQLGSRW